IPAGRENRDADGVGGGGAGHLRRGGDLHGRPQLHASVRVSATGHLAVDRALRPDVAGAIAITGAALALLPPPPGLAQVGRSAPGFAEPAPGLYCDAPSGLRIVDS